MSWETVATVVVALAGLGATVLTAAQARRHAERLATEGHLRDRAERVRQDRLGLYADALRHAVDQERKLDAVWESDGDRAYNLSPPPPGAPLALAAMDEITVRMRLLADNDVERAWVDFVRAWGDLYWWANNERSADPNERTPEKYERPLRDAIFNLKVECRRSLELDGAEEASK